jgi:hypothetical protein
MSKTQMMLFLLVIIIVGFSIFSHYKFFNKDSFKNIGLSYDIGSKIDYTIEMPNNSEYAGNMRYPGKAFLNIANGSKGFYYNNSSDDEQLFYGFPFYN